MWRRQANKADTPGRSVHVVEAWPFLLCAIAWLEGMAAPKRTTRARRQVAEIGRFCDGWINIPAETLLEAAVMVYAGESHRRRPLFTHLTTCAGGEVPLRQQSDRNASPVAALALHLSYSSQSLLSRRVYPVVDHNTLGAYVQLGPRRRRDSLPLADGILDRPIYRLRIEGFCTKQRTGRSMSRLGETDRRTGSRTDREQPVP